MSSNFEWNKQMTQQRLQARYEEAAGQRLAQQASPAPRRAAFRWRNPFTFLVALWRKRPRRRPQSPPAPHGATR
jgi:hypothetical protein